MLCITCFSMLTGSKWLTCCGHHQRVSHTNFFSVVPAVVQSGLGWHRSPDSSYAGVGTGQIEQDQIQRSPMLRMHTISRPLWHISVPKKHSEDEELWYFVYRWCTTFRRRYLIHSFIFFRPSTAANRRIPECEGSTLCARVYQKGWSPASCCAFWKVNITTWFEFHVNCVGLRHCHPKVDIW